MEVAPSRIKSPFVFNLASPKEVSLFHAFLAFKNGTTI